MRHVVYISECSSPHLSGFSRIIAREILIEEDDLSQLLISLNTSPFPFEKMASKPVFLKITRATSKKIRTRPTGV